MSESCQSAAVKKTNQVFSICKWIYKAIAAANFDEVQKISKFKIFWRKFLIYIKEKFTKLQLYPAVLG